MNKILRRYGDEFLKWHGPTIEADWRQVSLLHDLTAAVDGVRTARPLRMDRERECIWYEWLGDLPTMISLRGDDLTDMLMKAGLALAQVHETSVLRQADDAATPVRILPLEMFGIGPEDAIRFDEKLPTGFFHGDCWHSNVLVDPNGDCVLIDPIQSPWLFGHERFEQANGAVDLATMHMSLLVSVKLPQLLRLDIDARLEYGNVLLESYLGYFDAQSLKKQVLSLSRAIATTYISSYPVRINTLVGWIKLWLSKRVITAAANRGYR